MMGKLPGDCKLALDLLEVDTYGLDVTDRNLLTTMIEKFQGGAAGLDTLAATIGERCGNHRRCLRTISFEKKGSSSVRREEEWQPKKILSSSGLAIPVEVRYTDLHTNEEEVLCQRKTRHKWSLMVRSL